MTPETVVQGPDGSNYVESAVNCRGTNEPRVIWRKESASEWCAKGVEGFCARQKIRVAQRVCGRQYAAQLQELAGSEAVSGAGDTAPVAAPDSAHSVAEPPPTDVPAAVAVDASPVTETPKVIESPASGVQPAEAATSRDGVDLDDDQRQLEIERERLKIEQERLELRRQQVELQKQELELQRQLENRQPSPSASAATPVAPAATPATTREPARSESPAGGTPHRSVLGM